MVSPASLSILVFGLGAVLAANNDADKSFLAGASALGERLRNFVEEELQLETVAAQVKHERSSSTSSSLPALVSSLVKRIHRNRILLRRNVKGLRSRLQGRSSSSGRNETEAAPPLVSCCEVRQSLLRLDERFGANVNCALGCLGGQDYNNPFERERASDLARVFKETLDHDGDDGDFSWQYFVGIGGDHLEYPAAQLTTADGCGNRGDTRRRAIVHAVVNSGSGGPAQVIVVLDRAVTTSAQLDLGRALVHRELAGLSDRDQVSIIAAEPGVKEPAAFYYPLDPDCLVRRLVRATSDAKTEAAKFLNVVQPSFNAVTNHTAVLRAVGEIVKNTNSIPPESVVRLAYISAGRSESDVTPVLAALSENIRHNFIVESYFLVDKDLGASKRERRFMLQLSGSNGEFTDVSSTEQINAGNYYLPPGANVKNLTNENTVILPNFDTVSMTPVFSFAAPVILDDGSFVGVTGIDFSAKSFLADFAASPNQRDRYVCLLSREGTSSDLLVLYHPLLKTADSSVIMTHVLFSQIENVQDPYELTSHMVALPYGSRESKMSNSDKKKVFSWKWVEESDYIVVVVTIPSPKEATATEEFTEDSKEVLSDLPPLYYHRLDLFADKDRTLLCKNFNSLSTIDSATLYLSPQAFLSQPDSIVDVSSSSDPSKVMQSYMAYLTDQARVIVNPGLRKEVREDMTTLVQAAIPSWRARKRTSENYDIIGRFIASSSSGVLVSYPGERIPDSWDFSFSQWFMLCERFKERTIVTGPRLHPSGAGYAITVSQLVAKQNAGAIVAGLTFPLGLLGKILSEVLPECNGHQDLVCFLFDQDGMLAWHPIMSDPTYTGPLDHQHLNHREPNVGRDLMGHSGIVNKLFCNDFASGSVRRHYRFNESLHGVFTGDIHSCRKAYKLAPVKNTNLVVAMANVSCFAGSPVFCPCSITDSSCIICDNDSDSQMSCECPCECPMTEAYSSCPAGLRRGQITSEIETCDLQTLVAMAEDSRFMLVHKEKAKLNGLPECSESSCEENTDKLSCTSTAGCAWCEIEVEVDREFTASFSPIVHPYCAKQERCFRGAVGTANPYTTLRLPLLRHGGRTASSAAAASSSEDNESRVSPVGAIVGGILVFFIFMTLSVFCFRQKFSGESDASDACSAGFGPRRRTGTTRVVSNIEVDEDGEEEMREMGGHSNTIALTNADAGVVISPYRMNPSYVRRPLAPQVGGFCTDSSDHGYSTMTPLGGDLDSEVILPYTASGPARERLARHHRYHQHPPRLSGVSSSRASSPPALTSSSVTGKDGNNGPTGGEGEDEKLPFCNVSQTTGLENCVPRTVLRSNKNPNQFVVSATVHMADTS